MDQAASLRKLKENITQRYPTIDSSHTRVLAVTSGKGGVGKTTVAINMGLALGRLGKKVLVFDGDMGLANINVLLGVIPKYTLFHVLKGYKSLSEIIVQAGENTDFIPGASGYTQLANLGDEERDVLIRNFSQLEGYDYIIIDTGAGIGGNVMAMLMASDQIFIVTTPEPTSITDAYGLIKTVVARDREKDIKILVNKARDSIEAKKVAARVINISNKFLGIEIKEYGVVYLDSDVEKSIRLQKPFILTYPKSRASECITHISRSIIQSHLRNTQEDSKVSDYIKKLFYFLDGKQSKLEKI